MNENFVSERERVYVCVRVQLQMRLHKGSVQCQCAVLVVEAGISLLGERGLYEQLVDEQLVCCTRGCRQRMRVALRTCICTFARSRTPSTTASQSIICTYTLSLAYAQSLLHTHTHTHKRTHTHMWGCFCICVCKHTFVLFSPFQSAGTCGMTAAPSCLQEQGARSREKGKDLLGASEEELGVAGLCSWQGGWCPVINRFFVLFFFLNFARVCPEGMGQWPTLVRS